MSDTIKTDARVLKYKHGAHKNLVRDKAWKTAAGLVIFGIYQEESDVGHVFHEARLRAVS